MLSSWSAWGAVPDVFDESNTVWDGRRSELKSLLTEEQYVQARRTTLNAHYTDPRYVDAIWSAVTDLGFHQGTVLEPGAGIGTFVGLAPHGAEMTGVELDDISAQLSQALYPNATIRSESFVDTKYPTGYFDAAVGNVPFADITLHDRIDNANGHSIHNHFILKTLRLTRPGGIVAVISSHYTLDAGNPAARREMATYADFLGAVRLPSGAHRRNAGTEAVTDVLVFRRREPGQPPSDRLWEQVSARRIDDVKTRINSYYDTRPENILGTLSIGQGLYGAETLHVRSQNLDDVPAQLRAALSSIVTDARQRGLLMTERTESAPDLGETISASQWQGTITAREDGSFHMEGVSGEVSLRVPNSAAVELRTLLKIRDAAITQLENERLTLDDTDAIVQGRERLHTMWSRYVTQYGPINRFKQTPTGRTDADGQPILARRTPTAIRLLREDPFGPLVLGLEVFDDDLQSAQPAALLRQRVILPRAEKLGADNALEALHLSLNHSGTVDLEYIAHLLGIDAKDARGQLHGHVFDDPETGNVVSAPAYLSGNVRTKLEAAQAAAEHNDAYNENIAALSAIIPEPLTPAEIVPKIGAVWISAAYHQQFLREILRDQNVRIENPYSAKWIVRDASRHLLTARTEWGTERRPASDLFESSLNQSPIRVMDKLDDGTQIFNPTETAAALEKAALLEERFQEWVWEEPERARELAAEYNRRFNSIVLRDYTTEGQSLTFPGMTATFTLRDHQRSAVARMLSEPAVGLFHEVGAGKTAEMVTGAMELRRMGMVNKVAVVVPNHMLEQFTREWMQLYPQARILAAGSDTLAGDKRRLFVARAAANDWDAIIMTRTAFTRLGMQPENVETYMRQEVDVLRVALESASDLDRRTVKQIEKTIADAEEKLKKILDRDRDPGITFEATGIDYLIVDEFHDYKNLRTISNRSDAQIQGSERASDMAMKIDYLRRTHGDRVITAATATPIANSITEAHVMQRYLRPDLLRDAGIEAFDAWAATFGETVTDVEMAPQGGSNFRVKDRFAKFQNVPEMLRMWHVFADVKTAEDLNLPTPPLKARDDGQRVPETVVITPSEEVLGYVRELGERADMVAAKMVDPTEDNMLKISTDGRKAALDIRLVDPHAAPLEVPLDTVADNIAPIHRQNQNNHYLDPRTNEPSPLPGALQIVFCDLGTPKPDRWNAYDELREKLASRGIPAESIRFVQDAKNDREKAALFAAAREGRVSVLIGSTSTMGVGTNVQARAIALHDVDCPWRPADVAQRRGRIMRQGNQNSEIGIYQYVVEGTFSAYMWQAIERKSRFINQVMRGRLDVREIDDIGSDSLSAAEAKALASGNPLLLERSLALNELGKFERLERSHHRNQQVLRNEIDSAIYRITRLDAEIIALTEALPRAKDLSGDRFEITIDGRTYAKRTDAAAAITQWATGRNLQYARPVTDDRSRGEIGSISGFPITARTLSNAGIVNLDLTLTGIPGANVTLPVKDVLDPNHGGVIRMLENRIAGIQHFIDRDQQAIAKAQEDLDTANKGINTPFKHAQKLEDVRVKLAHIDEQMQILAAPATVDEKSVQLSATPAASSTGPFTPHTRPGSGPSWS